ncbi:MAG: hypothetical protein H6718_32845 [Polyangiaceae bacterium]|nr:hypothetical protein [Polyangiaceae bacterium]MCB9605099.1 hypothetical protein [Polyangiaceae bacterium]
MTGSLEIRRPYAELVLHVLAHVPLPEPGSLHEPAYAAFCAQRLGPSAGRELGEDVALLSQLLAPLDVRLEIQRLPLLFANSQDALRFALVDLHAFPDQGVRCFDEVVWRQLIPQRSVVEVLRMACEVERVHLEHLSPPRNSRALRRYLAELCPVAPALQGLEVCELRPLWRRGRLMGKQVWVGAAQPDEGPGLEHVAWQACHEATVWELSSRWRSGAAYDAHLERSAIALLAERASRAGFSEAHLEWFEHLGGELPRGIEELEGMHVPPELWSLVRELAAG